MRLRNVFSYQFRFCLLLFFSWLSACGCGGNYVSKAAGPEEKDETLDLYVEDYFVSSYDGSSQPLRYALPEAAGEEPRPALIFLHSWSSNYRLHKRSWLRAAQKRGWVFVEPDFRGPNNKPAACGSLAARTDILDSVEYAIRELGADPERIYLAGASGGGHMAALMAGRHPQRFTAVSTWVGISDLRQWYQDHTIDGKPERYAEMIALCCGGPPGASEEVDAEYVERSPIEWITGSDPLPLDIAAGVHDGQTGSVPFQHSIRLFNKMAEMSGEPLVTEAEMRQLWDDSELADPQPQDTQIDRSYGRDIKLRRTAGAARITIFEGGHEGLAEGACQWLSQFRRPTQPDVAGR
ncbi:MAG: alpha/beta hydrolase family protein [Blastopirellula sp. JB062]